MAADAHLPWHWRERLLHMLAAPPVRETLRLLDAWARAEGGTARNNPLNTTYPMPWSTDYNSVHVKNYAKPIEGISATASTFAREAYLLDLWKDLQHGVFTAEQLVDRNAAAIERWGTDLDLLRDVLAETP